MQKLHEHVSTRQTPQSEAILGKDQVKNTAGGFVFAVDDWIRLDRFLILGTEGGTYYQSEQKITKKNAQAVVRALSVNGQKVVRRVVEISESGRAPKNDPALFVLAMASCLGDEPTRKLAFESLSKVARIGTHLFTFCEYRQAFGGWGRGMRNAVRNWYHEKGTGLAYQLVKYRQRNGWTHRDILRLAHPKVEKDPLKSLYHFAVKGKIEAGVSPVIDGYLKVQNETNYKKIAALVSEHGLTREMIPTEALVSAEVWDALLVNMPMTALIRNLGNLSKVGLLTPMSDAEITVSEKLVNPESVKKSRLHPFSVLQALIIYQSGTGLKGKGQWNPVPKVIEALNKAFYLAFDNVVPANKKTLIGLDVSGSMSWAHLASGIDARTAAAAMAMVTVRTEPAYYTMAFTSQFEQIVLTPNMLLGEVISAMDNLNFDFGRTDCAIPMLWALQNNVPVETFIIYTDNETWTGNIHPVQALNQYRDKMGLASKLIVVGMTSTGFSIADPDDAGMMDVVGFDSSAPAIMADFAR